MLFFSLYSFGEEINYGGYGAFSFKYSPMNENSFLWGNGDSGALIGMRGGWIFNKKLEIGIAAYTLAAEREIKTKTLNDDNQFVTEKREQSFGYAGITAFYLYPINSLLSLSMGGIIGGGGHQLEGVFYDESDDEYKDWGVDTFFVMEPELSIDAEFNKIFRLSFGVSYRMVAGINDSAFIKAGSKDRFFNNADFSGLVIMSQIKFGKF